MTDTAMPLSLLDGEEDADTQAAGWQPVFIWFPRIVLCDTHMGLRRRLLLPGGRWVRMSRRHQCRVYRR